MLQGNVVSEAIKRRERESAKKESIILADHNQDRRRKESKFTRMMMDVCYIPFLPPYGVTPKTGVSKSIVVRRRR